MLEQFLNIMIPITVLFGIVWLVSYYNKGVTENKEPSETDELK